MCFVFDHYAGPGVNSRAEHQHSHKHTAGLSTAMLTFFHTRLLPPNSGPYFRTMNQFKKKSPSKEIGKHLNSTFMQLQCNIAVHPRGTSQSSRAHVRRLFPETLPVFPPGLQDHDPIAVFTRDSLLICTRYC